MSSLVRGWGPTIADVSRLLGLMEGGREGEGCLPECSLGSSAGMGAEGRLEDGRRENSHCRLGELILGEPSTLQGWAQVHHGAGLL